jgi:hypothetical protein
MMNLRLGYANPNEAFFQIRLRQNKLTELNIDQRKRIAGDWQAEFIDPKTGSFPY